MTDERKPSPRPLRYTRSFTVLITEEMHEDIKREAAELGVSQGVIGRRDLELGRSIFGK